MCWRRRSGGVREKTLRSRDRTARRRRLPRTRAGRSRPGGFFSTYRGVLPELTLPGRFAERSVILRHHLLELVGHLVGAREHDRLVARLHLAAQAELEPLQPLGRERLQALELLGVLVDALVLEPAQRRENLLQLLRIDVEAAQRAAQVLRLVGPLARLGAQLADVFIRQAAEVGAVVIRAVPRQVAVPVAAAVVSAAVLVAEAAGGAASLLATLLTASLLTALTLLAALALLAL